MSDIPSSHPFVDGAMYTDVVFEGSDARGLTLEAIDFNGCTFKECVFAEAVLRRWAFEGCRFIDCDLSNIKLPNARLTDVSFDRCKLIGIDWTPTGDVGASRLGLSIAFRQCQLDYGDFSGLDLRQVAFVDCVAKGAEFTAARLTGVDCTGTDFADARFSGTDFTGADLRRARNYRISPTANTIKRARFSLPEALRLLAEFGVRIE